MRTVRSPVRLIACAMACASMATLRATAAAPAATAIRPAPPKAAPLKAAPAKAAPAKAAPAPARKPSVSLPPGMTIPESYPGPLMQRMLAGPMTGVEEIVFAVRVPGHDHWYVTFGNYSDYSEYAQRLGFKKEEGVYWGYGEGGRLCRMNLRTGQVKVIFEDPRGGIRDPQVHYDGRRILFAYRKGGTHPYHLCEINADGTGFRQLTDGTDDDIEPVYCPDGSIVFSSSRCHRFVNCWYTRVSTLHRCDADGRNVRMLSSNNDHDNTPWLMNDGRVLYMRWEYVDRSQLDFHHLWAMNPDGTAQTVFYGNMNPGKVMLDAKPVGGSDRVVAIFSPGHGRPEHLGAVTLVDGSRGPDDLGASRTVSRTTDWKDPYALSENCFLVAHAKGLFVMDGEGNAEMIYRLPETDATLQCHEPRPLQPRPRERVVPSRVNLAKATGRLVLDDIYQGRAMQGVERGSIRKLLVLEQKPKPVNFSGGMEPLTIGGSFTLAGIVGEVPVEPDGSADMELPAVRSLFFVALDAQGRSVKRMHSFVTVQPGEVTGCVGCHEPRTQSPPPRPGLRMAMKRPPSPVVPVEGVPPVIDFPRDVQPILDRHCVSCHNPDRYAGKVDLTGDKTARYTISYWTLQTHGLVADGRNQPVGSRPPYSFGSGASRLMKYIDGSHNKAKLTDAEQRMIRMWLDTSATYPGTYASLGCGDYYPPYSYDALMKRCGSCHARDVADKKGEEHRALVFSRYAGRSNESCLNISRPEKALVLRAPLAREAGGLGLCREAVFKDANDPLYKSLLAGLQQANAALAKGKRFDMPGFRPNEHYLREMQRFGVLPRDLPPDAPVDVYATDRAYWDTFRYRPPAELAGP